MVVLLATTCNMCIHYPSMLLAIDFVLGYGLEEIKHLHLYRRIVARSV